MRQLEFRELGLGRRLRASGLWRVPSGRAVAVGAFLLAVLAFYIWTADTSPNPIHLNTPQADRYNELSDALLHGRAALLINPDPGLLHLKDPYDPAANNVFRQAGVHDLSFYHGRFYLYW